MKQVWDTIGLFPATEQRLADQTRQIRVNRWLIEMEIDKIRHRFETINLQDEDIDCLKNAKAKIG